MKKYIGTKEIMAEPMTMGEAYERGLLKAGRVPSESQKSDAGYHTKYNDGYESWSPAKPFEESYRVADTYLDRMKIELFELQHKIDKMIDFIHSEEFSSIPSKKRELISHQYDAMKSYYFDLKERIALE